MKPFDTWSIEKETLEHKAQNSIPFHEREIWWCSIGINLGDEQDGKNELFERPVLVIKKFNNRICWAVPMSTKQKEGKYYHPLIHDGHSFSVLLSQLRLVSVKRFRRRIRKISPHQFVQIRAKLARFLSEY